MPSRAPSRATRIFHQTLAATGSMAAAARAANIPLAEARRLRALPVPPGLAARLSAPGEGDGAGAARVAAAVAALEAEALRRALEGVSEPVFHQGRECGSKVKHSDTLLMFLLKTLRPERYGPATARREAENGEEGDPEGAEEGGHDPGALGAFVLDLDLSAGEEPAPETR